MITLVTFLYVNSCLTMATLSYVYYGPGLHKIPICTGSYISLDNSNGRDSWRFVESSLYELCKTTSTFLKAQS